jgi:hypothetical protein
MRVEHRPSVLGTDTIDRAPTPSTGHRHHRQGTDTIDRAVSDPTHWFSSTTTAPPCPQQLGGKANARPRKEGGDGTAHSTLTKARQHLPPLSARRAGFSITVDIPQY